MLDTFVPDGQIELIGHSLGGNISCVYAGLRPSRLAHVISLDGFGLRTHVSDNAPDHLTEWLNEWKKPFTPRYYESYEEVAERLMKANPRLDPAKAAFLSRHVVVEHAGHGLTWQFDPRHRRRFATLHYIDEWAACWRRITAPVLWIQSGDVFPQSIKTGDKNFDWRFAQLPNATLAQVAGTGHNLHHEKPEEVAAHIRNFIGREK